MTSTLDLVHNVWNQVDLAVYLAKREPLSRVFLWKSSAIEAWRVTSRQEIIKVREWIPHIGALTRVIHLNLFLDMVPSSSANFTRAIFPRCVFSWRKQRRRVMAYRASSKRKFEVSNAPSNNGKKTSPNLFCSKERTCTLCDRNKIENLLWLDCTPSYAAIRCILFWNRIQNIIYP